tara:strand:- start:98592 stop:99092 length:501 start_codon:yes stop_codon:yes gene_type:complete
MQGQKLDRIDLKILATLQRFGRITNVELAEAVHLSPSPCLARVKRLEKLGFISGYRAQIDLQKLGKFLTVFTEVTLSEHHREDFARFEKRISRIDEILECHLVSGGYDYLLKFITSSVARYQELIEEMLQDDGLGIDKYFSYIVIKSPFIKQYQPIEALLVDDHDS